MEKVMKYSSWWIPLACALGGTACSGADADAFEGAVDQNGVAAVDPENGAAPPDGDVGVVRQKGLFLSTPLDVVSCVGNKVPEKGGCDYTTAADGYAVTYRATDNVFGPGTTKIYKWDPPKGALKLGCATDSPFCTVILKPLCDYEPLLTTLEVTSPQQAGVDKQVGQQNIPFSIDVMGRTCERTACTAPPAAPVLSITSGFCRGEHFKKWNSGPGAVMYETRNRNAFSSCMPYSGVENSEYGDAGTASIGNVRACNACGCSGWSNDAHIPYYRQCL
jgi:hypothetical protein